MFKSEIDLHKLTFAPNGSWEYFAVFNPKADSAERAARSSVRLAVVETN